MERIELSKDIYCKDEKEVREWKKKLTNLGYDIKRGEVAKGKLGNYFFCVLSEKVLKRYGKCGNCQTLIDIHGIFAHGRKCESCHQLIASKVFPGDSIEFFFRGQPSTSLIDAANKYSGSIFSHVSLKIYKIFEDSSIIWFYPMPTENRRTTMEDQKELLKMFSDRYKVVEEETGKDKGKKFLSFYYRVGSGMLNEHTEINTAETHKAEENRGKPYQNCSVVKILDGVEYDEHDSYNGMSPKLPMPETLHIYKDWLIKKTAAELLHRIGLSGRPEYYSGRPVGDISAKKVVELYESILSNLGEAHAKEYRIMIKSLEADQFAGTPFVQAVLLLEANKWVWSPKFKKELAAIVVDSNNPLATMVGMVELLAGGMGRKSMCNIMGFSIKNEIEELLKN